MAGLNPGTPIPVEIKLHNKSRIVELAFENDERYEPVSYTHLDVYKRQI